MRNWFAAAVLMVCASTPSAAQTVDRETRSYGDRRLITRDGFEVTIVDPRSKDVVDQFQADDASISPSGRFIATRHMVQQHGLLFYPAVYLVYDLDQSAKANRMSSEWGGHGLDWEVGIAVYPPENRVAKSYDLEPDQAHAHARRSHLTWISATEFVFLDAVGGESRASTSRMALRAHGSRKPS